MKISFKRFSLINFFFIFIGIAIGIILSLQIRAVPLRLSSFPLDQLEIQKTLLAAFSDEQDQLKQKLAEAEGQLKEAKKVIEKRSSQKTKATLAHLKNLTDYEALEAPGIIITLQDNPDVSRLDFSNINENFVQAADLRDLVNALYLQDAKAIAINNQRINPLTPIVPLFDSMLIGNIRTGPPFSIAVIGNSTSLKEAIEHIKKRKIQIFLDTPERLYIEPIKRPRSIKFASLSK